MLPPKVPYVTAPLLKGLAKEAEITNGLKMPNIFLENVNGIHRDKFYG